MLDCLIGVLSPDVWERIQSSVSISDIEELENAITQAVDNAIEDFSISDINYGYV